VQYARVIILHKACEGSYRAPRNRFPLRRRTE
jgi:hypothetical protein